MMGYQLRQQVIVHRLQPHNDYVRLRHVGRSVVSVDMRQVEVAVARIHSQPMLHNVCVVAVQEKVNLKPSVCQAASVIAADGSHSYY